MTALERARDALRAGDDGAALAALLEAWRERRSAHLAALIDQLDRRVRRTRPAISGASQAARHARWLELAHGDDPSNIGSLLELLTDGYPARARERISLLVGRAPDPRISAALVALVAQPPDVAWVRPTSIPLWDVLFGALDQHRDARSSRVLDSLAWIDHERAPSPFEIARVRNRVTKLASQFRDRVGTIEPELTAAHVAACDELAALLVDADDHGPSLLTAVYANPSDRNARSVYADWLIAQNDPRGEFIALQLARTHHAPASPRERELLDAHRKVWLGPLAVVARSIELRDGFVYSVALPYERRPLDAVLSTTVELSAALDSAEDAAYVADPVFRALRDVGTFSMPALRALARLTRPLPFEVVHIASGGDIELAAELEPDLDLPLPALRTIVFHVSNGPLTPAEVHELFSTPLLARVREMRVDWAGDALARWAALFAMRPNLEELELLWNQFWNFTLLRDERGIVLQANVVRGGVSADAVENIPVLTMQSSGWLAGNAAATTTVIDAVELRDGRWPDDSPRVAEVTASLARLTGRAVVRTTVEPAGPKRRAR